MKIGSRRYLFLFLAAFAIVAAACSSEDAADLAPIIDAGAATAVAAASSVVSLEPIRADMDNDPAAFLDAIPEARSAAGDTCRVTLAHF